MRAFAVRVVVTLLPVTLLPVTLLVAACSAAPGPSSPSTTVSSRLEAPPGWVEDDVSFPSPSATIHGTYLHPTSPTPAPAALLIAGSGPTDRNGDSSAIPGSVGTLRAVARMLASTGVASLRYDKLGTGATGMGSVTDPATIGLDTFAAEAGAAASFLAAQPATDRAKLIAVGHSEGSLYAELLAAGRVAGAPAFHSIALLEPLALRLLDLVSRQIQGQVSAAEAGGQLTAAAGRQLLDATAAAVTATRSGSPLPSVPPQLAAVFSAGTARYLRQVDAVDPVGLAAALPAGMPALVSCSDADIQVACADASTLAAAIPGATLLQQHGVSHVLKVDGSRNATHYGDDLPYSPELTAAWPAFVAR